MEREETREETFMEAVRALDLLQDQLDWADVKSSWKSAAARWAKQLRKCRYPADLDLLWKLAGELMKSIKPTNFIGGWLVNADGSKLTRYRQWLTRTDASCACAILKAVRVLRAHLVRVVDGPLYALDGTPLPDAAHASAAPAPLATEPIEPPREKSAAGLAAAASDDEFLLLNTRRETPNRMRSQTLIPPAVEPRVAEGERSTVLPNHAVTLADRWLVQEMSSERLAEEAQKGVPEVEEHSSASAPCYERSMRKTPAAIDYAAVLATVEDDSAAAAQPWCIGGSVPGESAPTEVQLALIASDEDASDEAVALAEEVSQVSVDGDAHLATTEGLAAGAVYGSQVEVRWRWTPTVWHSVAESADNGLYTPRLRKACDLCHENRLKCTMLPTGSCEQCTVRGIECKRRMERKRGRPRITAENIVQLVQRRTAARKQLPGGASGRVRNAAARAIGAVPQSGAFPSFHDPAIQAAYAAGMQTATHQAQQAAVMMQYYGPAHTFSHTPPISLMAPHSFQPFGAPAHHVLQHPAFGGSTQPLFNGEAMAAMAGQYGVGGMDGSAAYEHYAAMYAHFQQQQQQQLSPPPGYSSYAHQSRHTTRAQ